EGGASENDLGGVTSITLYRSPQTQGRRLNDSVAVLSGPSRRRYGRRDGSEGERRPDGSARQGDNPCPADPVVERAADYPRCNQSVPDAEALDECRRHDRNGGFAQNDRTGEQRPDRVWRGPLLDGRPRGEPLDAAGNEREGSACPHGALSRPARRAQAGPYRRRAAGARRI